MVVDGVVAGNRADCQSAPAASAYSPVLAVCKQVGEAWCRAGEEEEGKVRKQ